MKNGWTRRLTTRQGDPDGQASVDGAHDQLTLLAPPFEKTRFDSWENLAKYMGKNQDLASYLQECMGKAYQAYQ
ncbi:hypothetical protein PHYPSEUDO_011053 [Phytophthora pseudosyringae]|uniref:Uncharacterized protein n=1 Tax=Phytophthora pseudosyringae TaxID=221518 RepID=A0A8T1VBZ6_9STRA|nr:hypothetical protein PHYPSEUDO_011053 [Phytophthora pseudosyringae]